MTERADLVANGVTEDRLAAALRDLEQREYLVVLGDPAGFETTYRTDYTNAENETARAILAALGAESAGGLDVERLSIAMTRAYVYGTGTAEQVAAEYAALGQDDPVKEGEK